MVAAIFTLIACAEDPAADPPRNLRIATWNVHRHFDDRCDSSTCGGSAYEPLPTPSELAERGAQIARAIDQLAADVVLLQEIESEAALEAINAPFPTAVLGEIGGSATLDVAVLARANMIEERSHRRRTLERPDGSRTTFSRELLEVHLDFDGARVIVLAAHFRSKVNDDPGRRYAEAEAAAEIVAALADEFPAALIVLGGDLNDVPGSPPIDALEARGLVRVAQDLAPNAATYVYNGDPLELDHLMVPEAAAARYVAKSARVVRDGERNFGGSDHAALFAEFTHLGVP